MSLIAYHIGNRHVPLEFGNNFLRLKYDHVLEKMINNLGGKVSKIVDEFNPVGGAYNHTLPTDSKIRRYIIFSNNDLVLSKYVKFV